MSGNEKAANASCNPSTVELIPPYGEVWERAREELHWLVYRLVAREGKKSQKIPQTRDGRNIGAKDAAALTFDEATKTAERLGEETQTEHHRPIKIGGRLYWRDFEVIELLKEMAYAE